MAMAKEGANIIITYNTQKGKAEKVVLEIKKIGSKVIAAQMNVSDRKNVQQTIQKVFKTFKRIDILVNNAGINITNDFDKISDKDWDKVVDTDLKGPFIVTQEVLKVMKKQKSGNIINISSLSGEDGGPRTPSYAAAKAGVLALTLNEAIFCSKYNIRVNCISSGGIVTQRNVKAIGSGVAGQSRIAVTPLQRRGTAEEVAYVALFLAANWSSYVNGANIVVDGGRTAITQGTYHGYD